MSKRKAEDASSDLPENKRMRCTSTQSTMSTRPAVRMYQPDEDAGARLLHIPGLILHLLEYTMMEEDYETHLWKWLAQIRRVCITFRDLTPELVPTKFSPSWREMNMRGALVCSLMRSFPAAPWKTKKIAKISNDSWLSNHFPREPERRPFFQALGMLLETPGLLPKLEELQLQTAHDGGVINADLLYAIARNLPRLSHLFFLGQEGSRLGERVTPEQFGTFAQLLQRPLQALTLDGCQMTEEHLNAFFINYNGSSLTELDLARNTIALDSDSVLNRISQQCSNLVRLSLESTRITTSGLEVILRANRGIRHLNLSCCGKLSSDSINDLVQHAPQLESLHVLCCKWFTDECLDRLVQGQIDHLIQGQMDHWEGGGRPVIPLRTVDVKYTRVSSAGIARVKSKPHVSSLLEVNMDVF